MWVFLNDSFLSIVADRNRKDRLLVRARAEGDIERVFPDAPIEHTPEADYPFRAFMPRRVVAGAISAAAMGIEYTNFKRSVKEVDRHDAYMSVWAVLRGFQNLRELVALRIERARAESRDDEDLDMDLDDDDIWIRSRAPEVR